MIVGFPKKFAVVAYVVLTSPTSGFAEEDLEETFTSDAVYSSQEYGIPEPMIFDLVRPLGSPKGELELNAFLSSDPSGRDFQWSPELEYAFADGYAVEVELPFENTTHQEYKLALQGTLTPHFNGRMVHGWQIISRRQHSSNVYGADVLYLNGARLSERWSTMNMVGARRTDFGGDGDNIGLVNLSVFYHRTARLIYGIELNGELIHSDWRYRLTPQVQYSFSDNKAIQVGLGPSNINEQRDTDLQFAIRFTRSF